MWSSSPLLLRLKLQVLSSLLTVGHCPRREGLQCDSLPAPLTCFDVGLLLFAQCSVFGFFSRGSCSILSHRFTVSPEGGKPRTLLCCHLQLELSAFNLGKKTMMWRTLPLPLFFRVHMCSPKQCISPTADASCDLNGA